MSEIQSIEGRPLKKGVSPGRRSAFGALALLGGALAVLVVGQLVQPPGIPEDHALAVILRDGTVALARVDGSDAVPLNGAGLPADATGLLLAPGGDFVALRSPAAIVVVDRAGVVSWRKAIAGPSATFAWSPDGSRIAIFDAGGGVSSDGSPRASLQILSRAGAVQWDVPLVDGFRVVPGYGNLAWSPDGGTIAFTGFTKPGSIGGVQPAALWTAAVATEALAPLGDAANAFSYGPAWAGDGTLYLARSSFEENGIWRVDPATGVTSLVIRRQTDSCAAGASCVFDQAGPIVPSPDASALAFRDPSRDLSILTLSSGAVTKVPRDDVVVTTPYAWTSDGRGLLYLGRAGGAGDPSVLDHLARFDIASRTSAVLLADVVAFDLQPAGS